MEQLIGVDLLTKIFSFLNGPTLLKVARVNKRWYDVARSDVCWYRIRDKILAINPKCSIYFENIKSNNRPNKIRRVESTSQTKCWKRPTGIWYIVKQRFFKNTLNQKIRYLKNNLEILTLFVGAYSGIELKKPDWEIHFNLYKKQLFNRQLYFCGVLYIKEAIIKLFYSLYFTVSHKYCPMEPGGPLA